MDGLSPAGRMQSFGFALSSVSDAPSVRMAEWMPLVNLGLPRTGTTSFACAARALGLNPLHANSYLDSRGHPQVASWIPVSQSVRQPAPLIHWFDDALSGREQRLLQFDALSDIPFCVSHTNVPVRVRIPRVAPKATFVCTERSDSSWASSMVSHGYAGASYLARRYNLSLPYRNRTRLREAKRKHYLWECEGVPRLKISWPSHVLWAALCDALPTARRGRCAEAQNWTWPRQVQEHASDSAVSQNGVVCGFS